MSPTVVRPYRVPSADLVNCGAWRVGKTPGETLRERAENWDYATELRLYRAVAVATARFAAGAALPDDASLAVIATWQASGTRRRDIAAVHYLQAGFELETLELEVVIPAGAASGVLELLTRVVLASEVAATDPLTAHRAGSELWVDSARVELEGGSAMFPIETRSFAADNAFPPEAAWLIHVSLDDLGSALSASVRVLLNTDVPHALLALQVGDSGERGDVVRQALRLDIARALLTRALRERVLEDAHQDFESGSLGRLLNDLLPLLLKGMPAIEARALLDRDPGEFDAHLQAAVRFLGESV